MCNYKLQFAVSQEKPDANGLYCRTATWNFNLAALAGSKKSKACEQSFPLKQSEEISSRLIQLFSFYVLFSQYRSRDNNLENYLFQIPSDSRACTLKWWKDKGLNSPWASIGKAKEVYSGDNVQSTFKSTWD